MDFARRVTKTVLWAASASFALAGVAHAQRFGYSQSSGREGDVDTFFSVGYIGGDTGTLSHYPNVHMDLDSAWMWGLGAAYHFTDTWSVLFDFNFAYTGMQLTGTQGNGYYRSDADYFNGRVNLEWTPRPGPISPVLSAGIGWNNFRTAVPGAPPQIICAPTFYYWWCGTGVPTFDTTAFAWNVGGGLRWDPSPGFFLKLMYTATFADFSGVNGTRQFNQLMLQIGGRVKTR
jgi:opacity protein-like surface antigen